jgi:hypothetical protein
MQVKPAVTMLNSGIETSQSALGPIQQLAHSANGLKTS